MNIKDFKESLNYLTQAQLTPFVWGHAGIGKSTVVKQFAEDNDYYFFPLYLGTQSDLGDVLGLAEFVENQDGTKSTAFATPKWLTDAIQYCKDNPTKGAILFLDEFNRARRDILQGMFSLALDKTFHTIRLPKNFHIIAAGNPPTDEYMTTDIDETALMARFVHIKLEPTFDEWLEYAKNTKHEATLISFLQEQPTLLENQGQEFKLPVKVDRRSFERLSRLFKLKTPTHLMDGLMPGIIGLERTVAYKQHIKNMERPLSAADVLTGVRRTQLKTWSSPDNIQASFLSVTCDDVLATFKDKLSKNVKLTAVEKENFMEFLEIIPKDIAYNLIQGLVFAEISKQKQEEKVFSDFHTDKLYSKRVADIVLVCLDKKEKEEK